MWELWLGSSLVLQALEYSEVRCEERGGQAIEEKRNIRTNLDRRL